MFCLGGLVNKIAINKKATVNTIPNKKVSHGFSPEALGRKTPITREPNIIFAPSERKFETILSCSLDSIHL